MKRVIEKFSSVRHCILSFALGAVCLVSPFSHLYARSYKGEWAIKSNVLYDATGTLNAGVEYSFSPKWSVELSGMYNPFNFSDGKKWQNAFVQPEIRYWFGKSLSGHFVGLHLQSGVFDAANITLPFNMAPRLEDNPHQGWFAGAGVSYGYQWYFSGGWFLEGALGIGYNNFSYDRYCPKCNGKTGSDSTNYFGVSSLKLSVGYRF